MATCCQSCEVMARYKYWNELPPVKHSFSKLMCGHFHIEMAIPKEFRECFKVELAEWCVLQGSSGNGWRVRVRRNRNNMFFFDGWLNFVSDHGVMLGDSCVFSYSGASTFKVLIFKECGSEREGAHFTHNSSSFPSPVGGLRRSNLVKRMLILSPWILLEKDQKTGKGKAPKSTEDDDKSSENEDDNEDDKSYKKRGRPSTSQGPKQRQTVHISRRRVVTTEEIETAYKEATNYVINNEPNVPRTQITMLRTHVYQGFRMEWRAAG